MDLDKSTMVYLTGGSGFVGSHLRTIFTERDVPVTLLIRKETSVSTRENENIQIGDITSQESLSIEDHDIVIHLAGQTSIEAAIENPDHTWRVNADGTLNVLEKAREAGVERFLYASTASIYGPPSYLPIDESHPMNPTEPYGASKLAGDGLVRSYASSYGLDTITARIFNAFGSNQPKHNVIPTMVSQALSKGVIELGNLSPSRDFIFIQDVINALITLIEEGTEGMAYNVARGESVTVGEMAKMVTEKIDPSIEVVSTADKRRSSSIEIDRHVAEISQLKKLGWTPNYTLEEGIEKMIKESNYHN